MRAIFVIVDYDLGPKLNQILQKELMPLRLVTHGYGTADSKLLEMLGLGENKKCILITIIQNEKVPKLYKRLDRELSLCRAGTGIVFSIPLTSISTAITKMYQIEKSDNSKERETMSDMPFELIITVVTRGYFDVVKNAAKSAGARGGTLIHGLGIGGEEAAKLLGISIHPEKDIILMVVHSEDKQVVMKKIIESAGILKESRGVCFSLPVDSAYGLAEKITDDDL